MSEKKGLSYKDAGVDIDAGNQAVQLLKDKVNETHGPEVLAGVGAFGGLYDLSQRIGRTSQVLAASTDGVGTKVRLATEFKRYAGLGQDLVNHCINDILVQGARPLFFLDYVASSRLDPVIVAEIVGGMADACGVAGCALLGGETAEMPGVYVEGELDVAGTIVGMVERHAIIDGSEIEVGDVVIGLPSASPHTNGYSLIRKIVANVDCAAVEPKLGCPPIDCLLEPHRSYLSDVDAIEAAGVQIRGLVHITGGGLVENPPRILRADVAMEIDLNGWQVPALYTWLAELGGVAASEMRRVFNMGLGMLVVVKAKDADTVIACSEFGGSVVGRIKARRQAAVEFVLGTTQSH